MRSKILHLEPTTRCQLSCPACPRTEFNDRIGIFDVDIQTVVDNLHGYDEVYMCGNHGDSIYHPQFHELLDAIQHHHPTVHIQFETNGSGRPVSWWETTASLLKDKDTVIFSVDGLKRNNHFYRIGSKWDTIEAGMRTVRRCNPTVRMNWKWIVFQHNQRDVAAGRALSKEIGFNRFTIVSSDRHGDEDDWLAPTRSMDDIMGELNG